MAHAVKHKPPDRSSLTKCVLLNFTEDRTQTSSTQIRDLEQMVVVDFSVIDAKRGELLTPEFYILTRRTRFLYVQGYNKTPWSQFKLY